MFGVALREQIVANVERVHTKALKRGYIIHPDCCTESVEKWLDSTTVNVNSTFHKNWEEVISKTRTDLWIEQLMHYMTGYVSNDNDYSLVPDIRKYKTITPISSKDLYDKCEGMITSGIALKKQTVEALCEYITKYIDATEALPARYAECLLEKIKNKEAVAIICDKYNILPGDKFNLLRYMVYCVTGDSQIIKDKYVINRIAHGNAFDMNRLSHTDMVNLSMIFYRFKPVFMGLKKQSTVNATIVNKIRRLAKKNHIPFYPGFWETLVNTQYSTEFVVARIWQDKPSNFKLIQLIQCCKENMLNYKSEDGYNAYVIRNGSVFYKKSERNTYDCQNLYQWWEKLKNILYNELTMRLQMKACMVKFPEKVNLTCPTSEKTFIGNIPYGTNYELSKNNIVSIYWRNEWGTRDFDLSYVDFRGNVISWCRNHISNNQSVIYSGDMVSADPEASEAIMFKGDVMNGEFRVNRFNGEPNSKYILTISRNDIDVLPKNYMVDPNTIEFQAEMTSDEKKGSMIGYVYDKKLYLCNLNISDSRVALYNPEAHEQVLGRKAKSFIDLKELLLDSGFIEYDEKLLKESKFDKSVDEENDILDLTNLSKDTIIDLLS